MRIAEKKTAQQEANRQLRDAMYTSRFAEPSKARMMMAPLAEAAAGAGLSTTSPGTNRPNSPYRLP